MSFTSTPPPTPTPVPAVVVAQSVLPATEPRWAKTIVSIFALCIFLSFSVIAYLTKTGLELMMGAAIGMATSVVGYWIGSSAGSDKKTDILNKTTPSQP